MSKVHEINKQYPGADNSGRRLQEYGNYITDLERWLAEAQEELNAWHQEFATTLDGRPYQMDALEAGKVVQDAEARARMAVQDLEEAQGKIEQVRLEHVHPLTSMTGHPCKVCAVLEELSRQSPPRRPRAPVGRCC